MKPSEVEVVIEAAITNRFPLMLVGAPGVCKTDLVRSVCAKTNTDLIVSHPVVEDPVESKGLPWVDAAQNVAKFIPLGDIVRLINAKTPTVYFMDDLGQAVPMVQASKMQLLLNRGINEFKVSDNVIFMAATNRRQDKAAVSGILEPVKSRFKSIVTIEPDVDDWIRWAIDKPEIPMELIAFIKFRPALLWAPEPTTDMTNSPSPRTVAAVGSWVSQTNLPKNILYEVVKGAAGEGFATEFMGFLDIYKEIPDPDYALMNPDTVEIPPKDKPGRRYAFAIAVAYRADETNADRFVKLIDRFSPEFSTLAMTTALGRCKEITATKGFQKWCVGHHNIMSDLQRYSK